MKKILVIEDNLEVRENIEEILALSDYEVVTAENGMIGVKKALAENPDLIICDVMMPELDGFGVLHILSKKPATSNIPFIFLTAKAEKTDFRKGMNLGADDYITKPFDGVELLDAIEMRIQKSNRIKTSFDGTFEGLTSFINEAKGQQDLEKLSEDRELRSFKKKDFLYREGDHPKRLYFLSKGKVKTFRTNEEGKDYIIQIYKAGEFIGYNSLIRQTSYAESAVAIENAEIAYIPKEDFFTLLYQNRDFASHFIKMLTNNIEEQEERLLSLAYNSIRKRVAEALVQLNDKYQEDNNNASFSILRDDLASIVGTAKESVIRTLTDFKNEKLIDINSGVISILNIDYLKNMPN